MPENFRILLVSNAFAPTYSLGLCFFSSCYKALNCYLKYSQTGPKRVPSGGQNSQLYHNCTSCRAQKMAPLLTEMPTSSSTVDSHSYTPYPSDFFWMKNWKLTESSSKSLLKACRKE